MVFYVRSEGEWILSMEGHHVPAGCLRKRYGVLVFDSVPWSWMIVPMALLFLRVCE